MGVGFGPLHNLAELRPVVHLVELQILHRRACDDHAVILLVPNPVEGGVEALQMVAVRVLGDIAGGAQQLHLNLKRGVGQLAEDLGLGDDLGGHQIEDENIQRTDVLMHSPVFRHDEDVLALQHRAGGEGIGYLNRHKAYLLWG